jgi:MFS family permease
VPEESSGDRRLAILLSMAMFVLVVDTSLMNVSISAVVHDLDTTASGVQSAIALEALVSAAFILIGSKIGDLIGRKRAYVIGLLGYAAGALSMTLSQSLTPIIIFWAIVGGLGASLLLPAMQSLIHGNFQGAMQRRAYALVGAAAAIAAAIGPLVGGFITTYLSWRIAFLGEVVIIAVVLVGSRRVHDVPYTGERGVDVVGAILSALGMGGVVLGILVWQEGGGAVGALLAVGVVALGSLAWWLVKRKREGKPALIDAELFRSTYFRLGISSQTLQQVALGGLMIALPIYLQMVLEYNAMQAGLSLAPLSLSMFRSRSDRRQASREAQPEQNHPRRVPAARRRGGRADPCRSAGRLRLGDGRAAPDRGCRSRAARVAAQQLHALADRGGARQRGRGRELRRRLLRALVRARLRRRDHARVALAPLHPHGKPEQGALAVRTATGREGSRGER